MKNTLLFILFLVIHWCANGQTTATNFTATDCGGASHTLFTELDAGKIVVLVWVMPCGGCISDARGGYGAALNFASTHPGKVIYWMADDHGDTNCGILESWATAIGIEPMNIAIFENAGEVINEDHYGGMGMPHVVVMGGGDHHIFYNKRSGTNDSADIAAAINLALFSATEVCQQTLADNQIQLIPNPAASNISVNYTLISEAQVSIHICDITGEKIKTLNCDIQSPGQHSYNIELGDVPPGIYFLTLNAGGSNRTIKFTVAN